MTLERAAGPGHTPAEKSFLVLFFKKEHAFLPDRSSDMDILAILLDLNGVIYTYDRAARIGHLAGLAGLTSTDVQAAIWDSGFEDAGDAGSMDAAAYLRGFGDRLGFDLSEAGWLVAQQRAVRPVAAMLALLRRLRPDLVLAVLTNNNLLVERHFSTLYPEVLELVGARAFVSASFGARKPDADIYRQCAARLAIAPAQILFVDDSSANVAGAHAAGMQACHFTTSSALEREFSTLDLMR